MSNFSLRIAATPQRILHVENEHNIVEIVVDVARDIALHGFFDESAMIVAPIWNSVIHGHGHRDFSLDFVRDTISHFGLDLIWRSAKFVPSGFDTWESKFERLGHTDERVEMEQRGYFCSAGSEAAHDSALPDSSWPVIRDMLAVCEDPNTHAQCLPTKETELDALGRLKAYIGQELPVCPLSHEWQPCIMGLELSLKYDDQMLACDFFSTIADQIASGGLGASLLVQDLALTPRIGYIVCNPILRCKTGFSRCRAREIAQEIVQALESRLRSGELRPYADLSWINLLSEIEALESKTWGEAAESDLPFFRPPASLEQIAQIEEELETTLPQDYKDFLVVTSGLGSFNRDQTAPLLSAEDIFWDSDYDTLKVEYRRFDSDSVIDQLPSLDRVLQVSDVDDGAGDVHWWLIEPALIQRARLSVGEDGSAEWLGVNHTEWHPNFSNRGSFRIMMERRLSYLVNERPVW